MPRGSICHQLMSKSPTWNDEKILDMKESLLKRMNRWDGLARSTLGVALKEATSGYDAKKQLEIAGDVQRRERVIMGISVRIHQGNPFC